MAIRNNKNKIIQLLMKNKMDIEKYNIKDEPVFFIYLILF